jgi:GT2 family glycosyltransferase
MTVSLCAYVPCFNNAATLRGAVESLWAQTMPPAEIVVVDDGSTDGSFQCVRDLGVRVVRHDTNLGRGAARARAMQETTHDFVLGCDATTRLEPDYAAKALRWLEEPRVAGVFGSIRQATQDTVANRWRGRHLFKLDVPRAPRRDAPLATAGAVVRRSAVAEVGGFDASLRHSEDADLGRRLLQRGFEVVSDPNLEIVCFANNTVAQVLERYWRWYAGAQENVNWRGYWKNIGYSVKAMAAQDLRHRDVGAALVSLACPHYQFWKSRMRGLNRRGGL